MSTRPLSTKILMGACALAVLPLAACSDYGNGGRPGYASDRDRGYDRGDRRNDRGDRRRDRDRNRDRDGYYLGDNDHIYRNRDGSYYCKKPDGTTGTIVGGLAGGVLGNVIAPGDSKTLGTILGAAGGAIAGRAIDRGNVRCR